MNFKNYNNIGIVAIAIEAILTHSVELPVSKVLLIFPFFSSKDLTQHLGRKTTKVKSIERLIIEKTPMFSNFNARFYDSLCLSINAIQFLLEKKVITINNGMIKTKKPFEYNKKMGLRAHRIFKASKNLAIVLEEQSEKLYLNLRIEI